MITAAKEELLLVFEHTGNVREYYYDEMDKELTDFITSIYHSCEGLEFLEQEVTNYLEDFNKRFNDIKTGRKRNHGVSISKSLNDVNHFGRFGCTIIFGPNEEGLVRIKPNTEQAFKTRI